MTFDELLADNTALRAQLAVVQANNEALALELARLKRQSFGARSERHVVSASQVGLFQEPEPSAPEPVEPPAAPPRQATPHGRRRPDGEPDEVLQVPTSPRCTRCGGSLREISTSTAT